MAAEDINEKKEIAFYGAGVAAWYNTSLEHDKSLFTLSAGGIGLLMTLIRTVGVQSAETLILYIAAMISFLICLVSVLVIFKKNRSHIEQVFQGKQEADHSLTVLDNVSILSFGIAVLFSAVIGISSAISSYTTKVTYMANENNKEESKSVSYSTFDSVNGISNLAPSNLLKKSFNGIGALQPQPIANQTTQPTNTAPPQTPTSSQNSGQK
ncbi:hypothetical protein [Methylobacter sp. S3L5C]|uniref:hypothetical protein n=1 Tax=Methylobacter sp. S3L5C TaxID=2839024 RepID=UPI001FAC214A|nr:hypothetical protein [Methylobacter sp. S3L5C]UOA09740.1 hypothetical protein KKZ03_05530 [Methylobacter sp. S3L5C]